MRPFLLPFLSLSLLSCGTAGGDRNALSDPVKDDSTPSLEEAADTDANGDTSANADIAGGADTAAAALAPESLAVELGGGVSISFRLISNGDGTDLQDPLERYTLSNDFYLMTTEVARGMFVALMGYDSQDGEYSEDSLGSVFPANNVSWHMAADFANQLSNSEGLASCYDCTVAGPAVSCTEAEDFSGIYECPGYRLPTEAEWELAARSGTASEFWTGEGSTLGGESSSSDCDTAVAILDDGDNPPLGDYAWYCGNSLSDMMAVEQLLENGYGLYDMHGNASEWTNGWYDLSYPRSTEDPVGVPDGSGHRVRRGGSVESTVTALRSSSSEGISPSARQMESGFRLARRAL
jgi:formylglycine-generating enzyme